MKGKKRLRMLRMLRMVEMLTRTPILLVILFVSGLSVVGKASGNESIGEKISKDDFAFGNEIEMTRIGSVVEVPLTEEVYLATRTQSRADLAIFNSKWEVVPHLLVTPDSTVINTSIPPVELTLFPVFGTKMDDSRFSHIKVTTSNDGAIVEIDGGTSPVELSKKLITGYVIDASKIKERVEKLQISLDGLQDNSFVHLIIQGSQDLRTWSNIENNGVLAKFEINNEKLTKDEIFLKGVSYPYYGISWQSHAAEIKLGSVKAVFAMQSETQEEFLSWKTVGGVKDATVNEQIIYQYDLGGHYPISGLKVKFADQNSVAKVSIEAAMVESGPWSSVSSETFFTVLKEGSEFSKLQTKFIGRTNRYWRLILKSSVAGVGSQFPEVSFGWGKDLVRFLARGEGPFTLAYGSAKIHTIPQAELISAEWAKEIGQGNLKSQVTLGGPAKLVIEAKSEYPLRKIALWSILVLAVILLGSMVLQVRKQLPPST